MLLTDALVPDAAVAAVRGNPAAKALDLTDLYCRRGGCPAAIGGVYVYRNADHISASYSRSMASELYQRLERLLGHGE